MHSYKFNRVSSPQASLSPCESLRVALKLPGSAPITPRLNMFSDPVAIYSQAHSPILGIGMRAGGVGSFRGMPYWNMDLSLKKKFRITERFSSEFQFVVTNLLNHNQFFDPLLDLTTPTAFGVLNSQGNNPRQMEFGLRVSF